MSENTQEIIISNTELILSINRHGAELCSIRHKETEYLWQADPAFWKRHSPVLFPIVGSLWEGKFRMDGREYPLSQHGFARDMDFTLLSHSETEVWYRLASNEETLQKFPRAFTLEIGYRLEGRKIHVMWKVENPSEETLDFQIGAHPAFYYRGEEAHDGTKGYFSFDKSEQLEYTLIAEKGCADPTRKYPLTLDEEGLLPIGPHTFERDALIFEEGQIREVTLHDSHRNPYLKMSFHTPLVGLWAPSPASPFVCIEPWYGRCDRTHYEGEFKGRDWVEHLPAQETFTGGYTIEIL